jgi:peptide deformylase
LEIIVAPDARLKAVCEPVAAVDDAVRRLMDDMLETMYEAPGIGLAAPQVGVRKRVVVVDIAGEEEERRPLRMANPRLLATSEETVVYEEGCLSFPEQFGDVRRPEHATVGYLDEAGAERELALDGLLATCVQHEIDHLDGILFVDYLTGLKRGMIVRRLAKAKRAKPSAGRMRA